MAPKLVYTSRRRFIQLMGASAPAVMTPTALAEALTRTPPQTEGPFYPADLPLDTDNDLVRVNNASDVAAGEVTHLTGRVLGPNGEPIRGATVEIWQVDSHGIYLHKESPHHDQRDTHFQGFGRFLTNRKGAYYFRTIKPVPYTFGVERAPHIHVVVNHGDKRLLTTQLYIKGHPLNEEDFVLNRVQDKAARQNVLVPFNKRPDTPAPELAARFDIILGTTPPDPDDQ